MPNVDDFSEAALQAKLKRIAELEEQLASEKRGSSLRRRPLPSQSELLCPSGNDDEEDEVTRSVPRAEPGQSGARECRTGVGGGGGLTGRARSAARGCVGGDGHSVNPETAELPDEADDIVSQPARRRHRNGPMPSSSVSMLCASGVASIDARSDIGSIQPFFGHGREAAVRTAIFHHNSQLCR